MLKKVILPLSNNLRRVKNEEEYCSSGSCSFVVGCAIRIWAGSGGKCGRDKRIWRSDDSFTGDNKSA
jgi:hypothetical protein